MLVLTRADVEALLTMQETIEAVEDGFRRFAAGEVVMPQRLATAVEPHDGIYLTMPCVVGGDPGAVAVKVVAVYGENPARFGLPAIQGLLLLYDPPTGRPLALMDAEHVTAMRTGAVSGVATKHLAREDAAVVTLFGAGPQARGQLEAVCAVRPIRRCLLVTRTGAHDAEFAREMGAKLGIEIAPERDVRAAVEAADVICTATNSEQPLFAGTWLRPGVHINSVGSFTAKMCELDPETVRRSRVFVDSHTAAQTEAGEIVQAIAAGAIAYSHVAGELGSLLQGDVPGRTRADEITLFKSVGLGLQDAVTAARVYAQAVAKGAGQSVAL